MHEQSYGNQVITLSRNKIKSHNFLDIKILALYKLNETYTLGVCLVGGGPTPVRSIRNLGFGESGERYTSLRTFDAGKRLAESHTKVVS